MSGARTSADAQLDDTLAATFPASDPPANTVETGIGGIVRGSGRKTMAEHVTDDSVFGKIQSLVDEEHRLFGQASLSDHDRVRMEEIKVALDRYWDLLRQRRALREFGDDPDRATLRPASTVEKYEQ